MSYYEGGYGFEFPIGDSFPDLAKRERYTEIVKDTISELYSNARYWEFFKTFNEASVHDFITEYASRKAYYVINGTRLISKKEREQFRFRDLAENCLWEIQQKKLFNLQAEWRAGLIELEGITVTHDFYCWEKAIARCPFLPAVTASELNIYMDYLESGSYEEKSWFCHWQDFDSIKNDTSCREIVPAWYRYYDLKMGTDYLMMLPDVKGEEEKMYLETWRQFNGKHSLSDLGDDMMTSGNGPELRLNYETLDFFIKTFESRNLLNFFQAAEKQPTDIANDTLLQESLRTLQKAESKIRLPEENDWKQAVIKGALKYKTNQIFINLPNVFDEYLIRIKSGISFPETEDSEIYNEYLAFTLLFRQQIDEGKRLVERK